MLKFAFSIQTRTGQKVDNIAIIGRDREEAERKLRQMYRDCEVLCCNIKYKQAGDKQWQAAPLEDALPLIVK